MSATRSSHPRTYARRLYVVRVDVYEAGSQYAFPVVTHLFNGRNRKEAWHYHESHRKSDAFLRQCEDKGTFGSDVKCRIHVTEGWR